MGQGTDHSVIINILDIMYTTLNAHCDSCIFRPDDNQTDVPWTTLDLAPSSCIMSN